jgi:galactokinase
MREVTAEAPGRVNLIGEHTDYHDGFVMPSVVPQRTRATVRLRNDRRVHATSAQLPGVLDYEIGREQVASNWGDYVQGVTWCLDRAGFAIRGFDLRIDSDVPVGSGLSSSAALEVAVLRVLRDAFQLAITDLDLARYAHRAETGFVGAPVGIMDQMAASLGHEREALFLDTRSLVYQVHLLPASMELLVINSGVRHRHAGGEYVTRRRESEEAARHLGVERLRDAPADWRERIAAMTPLLARRARHVITENARVHQARDALLGEDLRTFGDLLRASHASLRDDYEVTVPEVDRLVELTERRPGVFGARMTGGGFGGAIVAAVQAGTAVETGREVVAAFTRDSASDAAVLVPPP